MATKTNQSTIKRSLHRIPPAKLTGDRSRLSGYVSGLSGNVDECGLTPEDRARGVNIADLVAPHDEKKVA